MFKTLSIREHIFYSVVKQTTLDDLPKIKNAFLEHTNFVLVGHKWGDGDSFSSMYALAFLLKDLGKNVTILTDQEIPRNLSFLLDLYGQIKVANNSVDIREAEVVIFVDIPHPSEIDNAFDRTQLSSKVKFIEFDHHVGPGNIRLFRNSLAAYDMVSSTAELLFNFMRKHNFSITHKIAMSLALGLVSDTNNFRFMTSSSTLRMKRHLIQILQVTFNELFDDISLLDSAEHKLLTHLKRTLKRDGNIGFITLKKATIEKFLRRRTLSLPAFSIIVNFLGYGIDGIDVLVYFYELSPNKFKVGLRKYPNHEGAELDEQIDLRVVADHFSGGGHIGAAGFTLELKDEDMLEDKIKDIIDFVKRFIAH